MAPIGKKRKFSLMCSHFIDTKHQSAIRKITFSGLLMTIRIATKSFIFPGYAKCVFTSNRYKSHEAFSDPGYGSNWHIVGKGFSGHLYGF